MTAPLAPDPDWARILISDEEEQAWQDATERLDRQREHAPAGTPILGAVAPEHRCPPRNGDPTPPNAAPPIRDAASRTASTSPAPAGFAEPAGATPHRRNAAP